MKHVKMMYLKSCTYCKQAFAMVDELKQLHKEYQDIEIETIEENDEPEDVYKRQGLQTDIDGGIAIEVEEFSNCFATEDQTYGMTCFLEKVKEKTFSNK